MHYEHTQIIGYRPLGWAIISTRIGASAMLLVGAPTQAVGVLVTVVSVTAVLFGSLTVWVTDDTLIWYFGPRFWRNTLSLDAIEHVEPVQNSWIHGWGIQRIEAGWLYNVAGFEAGEIETTDGRRIRLGTDEPEQLVAVLTSDPEKPT